MLHAVCLAGNLTCLSHTNDTTNTQNGCKSTQNASVPVSNIYGIILNIIWLDIYPSIYIYPDQIFIIRQAKRGLAKTSNVCVQNSFFDRNCAL